MTRHECICDRKTNAFDPACLVHGHVSLGARANLWRRSRFGSTGTDPAWVLAKLTEEVGEVARAVIGEHEGREGRGDPIAELAQVVIVACSLADVLLPGVDLVRLARDEMERLEAEMEFRR